ncbi:hypothetical protein BDR04DRAFT_1123949 [Suillus decipiens]|nr:hypothetical protein BDR04DRAFT_1123949 [Suillus decipiens]
MSWEIYAQSLLDSNSDVDDKDKSVPKDRKARLSIMSNVRVKRGVVVLDNEDEEVPRKAHKKITHPLSQTIPNTANQPVDQVVRVSCLSSHCLNDVVDDTGDKVDQTDLDALISSLGEEEEDIKLQAKKRKFKKVVPVRLHAYVHNSQVINYSYSYDGFPDTKDYSLYKSVSDEEAVAEGARKRKPKKVFPDTEEYSSYDSISEDEVVEVVLEDAKKPKGKKKAELKLKDEAGGQTGIG